MSTPYYQDDSVTLWHGDCLEVLRTLPDDSVDSIVTDPPYGLGFMGKEWDALPPGLPWARECLRVLKPGGHLLAFGGTRTWHRLACAVEDAGFEVRDSIAFLYGSGFPKSRNLDRDDSGRFCRCWMGESKRGDGGQSAAQHDMRPMSDGNVPTAGPIVSRDGSLLLPSLPEQGVPTAGRAELRASEDGGSEPGMEGWGDAQASSRELLGGALRPLPTGPPSDGPSGRLHHGAPPSNGPLDGSTTNASRGREPQGSRPVEQQPVESGVVSDERRPQAWGGWPVCERCSQPVITRGLGTALKPAFEPIVVARKPLIGTVAQNVLTHGTGALNIDACRVAHGSDVDLSREQRQASATAGMSGLGESGFKADHTQALYAPGGRWPANVVLDEDQAAALDEQSGTLISGKMRAGTRPRGVRETYGQDAAAGYETAADTPGDAGGASRFFYTAKADSGERVRVNGVAHPTVKPLSLMRWLVRLVTPPGGVVLEPFAGSGTTVEACILEGFRCVAIEREADYLPLIVQRINRRRDPVAAVRAALAEGDDEGLFGLLDGGVA